MIVRPRPRASTPISSSPASTCSTTSPTWARTRTAARPTRIAPARRSPPISARCAVPTPERRSTTSRPRSSRPSTVWTPTSSRSWRWRTPRPSPTCPVNPVTRPWPIWWTNSTRLLVLRSGDTSPRRPSCRPMRTSSVPRSSTDSTRCARRGRRSSSWMMPTPMPVSHWPRSSWPRTPGAPSSPSPITSSRRVLGRTTVPVRASRTPRVLPRPRPCSTGAPRSSPASRCSCSVTSTPTAWRIRS